MDRTNQLVAMPRFGWGIIQSGILAPSIGWIAIGWSVLWLVAGLVPGVGAPAIPFIMPAVIRFALFRGLG